MRPQTVTSLLSASALFATSNVLASIFGSSPDIEVIGYFPDDNPLSIVYNGPRGNAINLKITNHAKNDISIDAISGAFREVGGKERHLANTTTAKYSLVLPGGKVAPVDVSYKFWSELKPQDLGFVVYVDYSDASDLKKVVHRAVGYDGTVTVKEPVGSWFDLQLLLLYPLVLALVGLPLYWVYTAFIAPRIFGKPKGKGKRGTTSSGSTAVVAKSPTPRPSTPSDPNEWIPQHHLLTRRSVSGRNLVSRGTGGVTPNLTSDGETSGNESATGPKSPRRSARAAKGKKA
ncbi:hypothetical protein EMMF5_000815 [Cystobasidiomycetes sp. EMM_F5]